MTGKTTKREKGQALVMFLGFAAAMIGIMLVSFNSGQVTNAKMRAMNAADAAAYSGAVWEARSLNFQAYMNRAMVVNEVTIAQSVSLRSWVDYLARFISNINMVTQFVPYLGTVTTTISRGLDRVDEAMQRTLPFFEQSSRVLAHMEHEAQKAFNLGGPLGALDIAEEVAKRNGANISRGGYALIATNAVQWGQFTETYSQNNRPAGTSGDGRKRMRQVTLDSRDGFTQDRAWDLNFIIGKLDKQGGTDLVNYDAWKGLDSVAMCTGIIKCRPWVPVGWGGAQAYAPRQANGIGTHGNGSDWNRADGRVARTEANSKKQATALSFVFSDYRDLQDLRTSRDARRKLPFAVEVLIADRDVPTMNRVSGAKAALTDGTAIEHDPQYAANGGVFGLAEACVSFERPVGAARVDGGTELPSLFNPYWRASLATPSRLTRGEAGAVKGIPPIDAFVGGEGTCS